MIYVNIHIYIYTPEIHTEKCSHIIRMFNQVHKQGNIYRAITLLVIVIKNFFNFNLYIKKISAYIALRVNSF